MLRRVRLRPEHLPVPIYASVVEGAALPIPATWLGIVASRQKRRDSYELGFYTDEGQWLEGLQFESLSIALDQAADIVGVGPEEWEKTELVLPQSGGDIPWKPGT